MSIVQNKPNYSIADCGLGIGHGPVAGRPPCGLPSPACTGQLCKTKPIRRRPADCARQSQLPWKVSGEDAQPTKSRGNHAKRTQFPADEIPHDPIIPIRCLSCETNPISAGRDTHYSIIPPFQPDANRAKRSQFRSRCSEMGAGRRAWAPAGANYAKRGQFSRRGRVGQGLRGELCETKPNLGRMEYLGDGAPGRGQWCKTNPILGSGRYQGS
jgi:hypothetical protein